MASAGATAPAWSGERERSRGWWLFVGALLSLLLVASALALAGKENGLASLERLLGVRATAPAHVLTPGPPAPPPPLAPPLPTLQPVSTDAAGSAIERASYASAALDGAGSFLVYLPPGYAATAQRYPVLYLLHGRDGHATSFLEIGLQRTLDGLIARGAIPPLVAVMVQDAPGLNNWRDIGRQLSATYVVEVQELADRLLRTIPLRADRAIAGSSMGGFGAMNVALSNPLRFSVVESWLGYFNNLEGLLQGDAPVIRRLGLHAFLYGAEEDPVAVPSEDPEFAAELNAAGAHARAVIYPGGHSLEKVEEHLQTGLLFWARALRDAQAEAAR